MENRTESIKIVSYKDDINYNINVIQASLCYEAQCGDVYYYSRLSTFVVKVMSGNHTLYYQNWLNESLWKNLSRSGKPYYGVFYHCIQRNTYYLFDIFVRRTYQMVTPEISALVANNSSLVINQELHLSGILSLGQDTRLLFDGGKLIGDIILEGHNNYVDSSIVPIFEGTKTTGVWATKESYTEWWGAKGNNHTDDKEAIQAALDSAFESVVLLNRIYKIKATIVIKKPKTLLSRRQDNYSGGTPRIVGYVDQWNAADFTLCNILASNAKLKNFGLCWETNESGSSPITYGLVASSANNIYIEGINTIRCMTGFYLSIDNLIMQNCAAMGMEIAYKISDSNSVHLVNCYCLSYRRNAFYLSGITNLKMENCAVDRLSTNHIVASTGDELFPYAFINCSHAQIINCATEESARGAYFHSCNDLSLCNSWFDLRYMHLSPARVLLFEGYNDVEINGLYVSNWKATEWIDHEKIGWFHEENLFFVNSGHELTNNIHLHNVYFRGRKYFDDGAGIWQNIESSLVALNNLSSGVRIDYDWSKVGLSINKPSGLDAIVGKGWTYYETDTHSLMQWDGSSWVTL